MSDIDKVIHEVSGMNKEHAKKAGRYFGQVLDKHNAQSREKRDKRYDNDLHEITKYHEDRVMTNRTYH